MRNIKLSDEEVETRTNVTIKLANAAGESAEQASEQLTAIWNNFYDGSKSLEYYADVMTALGASTASSTEEISAGVQKFAAIGDTVGLSYEYAASALATITATTRESADTVGTALRTLFARIEGLMQDEEAEDGTTLNKYSQALANVGIQIKDTEGNLKDMDQIFNEMGSTWATLTREQQMALAQTVGGVRQYAQLIALMDNWTFFQKNLTTAYESTGSLQKQAKIYADSWEGARDRVRTAAEDIYDSIINDDAFISLDDTITPVLSTIADIVDALGGMKGVITLLGVTFVDVFSSKISKSLQDAAYNFTYFIGIANKNQRNMKDQAGKLALELATTSSSMDQTQMGQARVQAEDIQMQLAINDNAKKLTDEQIKQLQNYKDMISQMKLVLVEAEKEALAEQEKTEELRAQTLELVKQKGKNQDTSNTGHASESPEKTAVHNLGTKLYGIHVLSDRGTDRNQGRAEEDKFVKGKNATDFGISDETVKNAQRLFEIFEKLKTTQGELQATVNFIKGIGKDSELSAETVEALRKKIQELTGIDTSNMTFEELKATAGSLEQELNKVSNAAGEVEGRLKDINGIPGEPLHQYGEQVRSSAEHTLNLTNSQRLAEEETERFKRKVAEATLTTYSWSDILVSMSSQLMHLSMVFQAFKNLGSIWDNDDLTTGEKITQTITSVSMILSGLIPIMKSLTVTREVEVAVTNAELEALKKESAYRLISTKTVDGQTTAVIANTVAWYANPVFIIAGVIMGVVAAIALHTAKVEKDTKALKENAEAESKRAHEAAEAAKEEADNAISLYKEYAQLQNSLDDSDEAKANLRKTTEKLCEALEVEWDALDKVAGKYNEVNEQILKNLRLKAQDALKKTSEDINSEESEFLVKQSTYKYIPSIDNEGYQVNFDVGKNSEEIYNMLIDKSKENNSSIDWSWLYRSIFLGDQVTAIINDADELSQVYEQVKEVISDINANRPELVDDELYKELDDWLAASEEYVENLDVLNGQLETQAQDYIMAETALAGYEISNAKTIDEYNALREEYIKNLRNIYETSPEEYGLTIPEDVQQQGEEAIQEYFNNLADSYLRGYTQLADLQDKSDVLSEILSKIGEENKDLIESYLNSDEIDISIFAGLNWDVIGEADDTKLQSAIDNAYKEASAAARQEQLQIDIPLVISTIDTLKEGNELDEDQLELVQRLEKEYSQLGAIRDKSSNAYIQALMDIREGLETENSLAQVKKLNDALDVFPKTSTGQLSIDDENFNKAMSDLLDADYAVQVAIEADLQTDVDDIIGHVQEVEEATSLIQEGFLVAYDDIDKVAAAFPGILAGYTVTAGGMIQLNSDIAESSVELASTQIENEKSAAKADIEAYQQVLLAKAAAMRKIAEGLAELNKLDSEGSEDTADAKAKVEEGFVDFQSALNDEKALLSENLAQSEINDANQVLAANDNASTTSDNNWSNAYKSMAHNSDEWAKIAINNARKVATAMKQAETGEVTVTPEATMGGIFTRYQGGYEEALYENTYESQGETETDWSDYYKKGDYQGAYEAAIKQAEQYEETVAQLEAWKAKIDAGSQLAGNKVNTVGRGEDKDKDSGSSKDADTKDLLDPKTEKDIEDRYHEITRAIQDQDEAIQDLDDSIERTYGTKRLDLFKKKISELTKQADNYQTKLKEAQDYLVKDKLDVMDKLGLTEDSFGENGEIKDYKGVLESIRTEYNAFVDAYNAVIDNYNSLSGEEQEALASEIEQWEKLKDDADQNYQDKLDALQQYEDTLDEIQQNLNDWEDTMRAIEDQKLEEITYKMDVYLEVKNAQDAVRDFNKQITESFSDALYNSIHGFTGKGAAELGYEQAREEWGMLARYNEEYERLQDLLANANEFTDVDAIKSELADLQSEVISSGEAILDWIESLETLVPDALDAAKQKFDEFNNQLEHNSTMLDTIKELYTLQGQTYKTSQGFNRFQRLAQEQLDISLAQIQLNRTRMEQIQDNLKRAQDDYEALLNEYGGDIIQAQGDVRYDAIKANLDAYLQEFNESQEALYQAAQEAMQTAQDMYLDRVEKTVYDFGQVLSNNLGLDFLQEKYDHYIETNERYFDQVNEAYQVASWYNKLQADIDKTTNPLYAQRLKALQKEIDLRRQGNTLSEYDMKILEAKYKALQAQAALEDAQNNKTQLRLVRDRQGNWNYQYTANQDEIAQKQQEMLDAENEWYNIAKQQVQDVTGEIVSTWKECQDTIQDVYSDMTLTDEERSAKAQEIYEYYCDKIKYLEEEKQNALQDISEAGNESLEKSAQATGAAIAGIAEEFNSSWADALDDMTSGTNDFSFLLNNALNDLSSDFENYLSTVEMVADQSKTALGNLDYEVNNLSDSTDDCRDYMRDLSNTLEDQIDIVDELARKYIELSEAMGKAVQNQFSGLSGSIADTITQQSGLNVDPYKDYVDYSALIEYGLKHGLFDYQDDTYKQLFEEREAKILNSEEAREKGEDWYIAQGEKAQEWFKSFLEGQSLDSSNMYKDFSEKDFIKFLHDIGIPGFATGGYTGDFNDAKLAFLHEKELVLNAGDTENILAAVAAVRAIDPVVFQAIESLLDKSAGAGQALMGSKLMSGTVQSTASTIEQSVHIEASFPNVSDRNEIEEAFNNLINDASQWANIRKQ